MDTYDRDGKPISLDQWTQLHGNIEYLRVAQTELGPYTVSTVWLGIDHGWGRSHAPIIFETMVFAMHEPAADQRPEWLDYCDRYSTEEEARRGHEEAVTLVRATMPGAEVAEDQPAAHPQD